MNEIIIKHEYKNNKLLTLELVLMFINFYYITKNIKKQEEIIEKLEKHIKEKG